MCNVLIKGFKSDAHAKTFISWYEGQAEQDFPIWAECDDTLTEEEQRGAYVNLQETYPLKQDDSGNWIMIVK